MSQVVALMATVAVSGPGRQLAALAPELADVGIDLRVLLLQRQPGRSAYAEYLDRAGVPNERVADRGPLDWRMVGLVRERLDALNAAVVQTHGYKATAVGYALSRRSGPRPPWIGFFHGATDKDLKDRAYHAVERRMLRRADRIVVVSRTQTDHFPGCARALRVIPNAMVPLPDADPADARAVAERLADRVRPRLGVIGRLSPEKGVDVFLRACANLARDGTPFTGVVVGDGPEERALRMLARELGLNDRIEFLGRVESVGEVYRHLDLVVLPSRSEGLPNVLLEALAADLPVVATRVGAVPEVLAAPGSGHVVEPGSPDALAAAVRTALLDGTTPGATDARRAALSAYSLDRRARLHVDLYDDVLAASAPAGGG